MGIDVRLSRIKIQNFRSIKSLDLELGSTTVFIGPNNAGKTAILDAIRIALTRKWGQRGTGFTEYDVHLPDETADPKQSAGISIEIAFEEGTANEWPDDVIQELEHLVQLDPETGRNAIYLRTSCAWNEADGVYVPRWEFLNTRREPLMGAAARRTNLERFWQFMPVFYLGALRDADDEFSPRSQFWGRLLKAVEIPSALEGRVTKVLDALNSRLLQADPRLGEIATTLTGVTRIASVDQSGGANLRLLPLKPWDMLSRAEIILRNESTRPWLPLSNHGQGVQSLSVIFLFQAFVEHLLHEFYSVGSSPILALEEPETHLHPQAARTLWRHVRDLPGQKLITTHSPYFVQHVPFRDIRMVSLSNEGTIVKSLPSTFAGTVPHNGELQQIVDRSNGILNYVRSTGQLVVRGMLTEQLCRSLMRCFAAQPDVLPAIRHLRDESKHYVSDEDLQDLETFARRVRGEIFFARRWLIVEGQTEYHLAHALGRALAYDLDEHGVSVIDAKNSGDPAKFAILARALGIPWVAMFDGDNAGQGYVRAISAREFSAEEVALRCRCLPAATLEQQLIDDGLGRTLRQILTDLGVQNALTLTDEQLKAELEKRKTAYAAELSKIVETDADVAAMMPGVFREAINSLRDLT